MCARERSGQDNSTKAAACDMSVKQPLEAVFSSCIFWYSALATLWCDRKLFVIFLLCNHYAVNHEMTENEIPATIQSPPGNNSPPKSKSNHPEPTKKEYHPSRCH